MGIKHLRPVDGPLGNGLPAVSGQLYEGATLKEDGAGIRIKSVAMKTYNFKVVIEPDEDFEGRRLGWHAYCPALKTLGGATWGETREEALKNINEVVRMIVEEFIEEGRPLPEGPEDSVQVEEVSQEQHRIAVTVCQPWPSTIVASMRLPREI